MRQKPYLLKKDWVTGQDESGEDIFLKLGDSLMGAKRQTDESFEDYKLRQKVENGLVSSEIKVNGELSPLMKRTPLSMLFGCLC